MNLNPSLRHTRNQRGQAMAGPRIPGAPLFTIFAEQMSAPDKAGERL
jgi:hypothetical protein